MYQENIYQGTAPFHSFKKVAANLGSEAEGLELVSFHSVSKVSNEPRSKQRARRS